MTKVQVPPRGSAPLAPEGLAPQPASLPVAAQPVAAQSAAAQAPRLEPGDVDRGAAQRALGAITNREQPATLRVIAKYPGPRSSSEAAVLVDRAFALDQGGQPKKAIELYQRAEPLLRAEIADALGDAMTAKGLSKAELLALSPYATPMIVGFLDRSGLFAQLPEGTQETTLRYLNRHGLAIAHDGAPGTASIFFGQATQLRPGYGPAHYNLGAATTQIEGPNIDVGSRTREALGHLGRALDADRPFFTKLALSDPDWNALRGDDRFRALVGLA